MFLHIGGNISIYKNDIISILDKKVLEKSKKNNTFFKKQIINIDDNVKTYILTERDGEYRIYGSNISSSTLLNR